jgi:hypothetical protein
MDPRQIPRSAEGRRIFGMTSVMDWRLFRTKVWILVFILQANGVKSCHDSSRSAGYPGLSGL